MSALKTPIVVVLGATGAGKSQLALELARKFGGEIINADAMQMYKGLDIVTNKVTAEEQAMVKHHMINFLDPLKINNVVDFRNKALPVVENLLNEGKIPIICGGTCYYIESLLWKVLIDDAMPFILNGKRPLDDEMYEQNKAFKASDSHSEGDDDISKDIQSKLKNIVWTEDPGLPSTADLYLMLQSVDPERASVLHPKERRKIWRSLQVYCKTGVTHSKLLQSQKGNDVGMGGGLRFDQENICIFEVWSEQEILDKRCDKRVDKMLARGLVKELLDFHKDYNQVRTDGSLDELDYTKGIWQSIGFKEFHKFLCLNDSERETTEGKQLFENGVERMKISTRQYSRRQLKWIRRRFLYKTRNPPPLYRLDSSDPSLWIEKVYNPAESILEDFVAGVKPKIQPIERISSHEDRDEDCRRTLHCDICNRDFKGSEQYKRHLQSNAHKKVAKKTTDKYHFEVTLTAYDENEKNKTAQVIKNTFGIGLSNVLESLKILPTTLSTVVGKTKAENIASELMKNGIQVELNKKLLQREVDEFKE